MAKKNTPTRKEIKRLVRLPAALDAKLVKLADSQHRSINSQVIEMIEVAFEFGVFDVRPQEATK